MDNNQVGISVGVEEQIISEENDSKSETAGLLSTFLITVTIVALIALGMFFGYLIWGNHNSNGSSQAANSMNSSAPSDIASLLGDSSNSDATGSWTLYTDINFSFKYPVTWLLKRGLVAKDDLVVYDPKSIKQTTQNGSQVRTPSAYLDITSMTASSQSAAETAAVFVDSQKQKGVTIQTEQSPTYNSDLVLFDNPGVNGKSIIWSQNGMEAMFNSSIQHLTENTTENHILQSFQFINQK